jgi:hypothetical protein
MRDERPVLLAAKLAVARALENPAMNGGEIENIAATAAKGHGGSGIEAR